MSSVQRRPSCNRTDEGRLQLNMGIEGRFSRIVRRGIWPLHRGGAGRWRATGGGVSISNTASAPGPSRWRSGGSSRNGRVDGAAPAAVQRPPSMKAQMIAMLRPDLPRVSDRQWRCAVSLTLNVFVGTLSHISLVLQLLSIWSDIFVTAFAFVLT